MKMINKATSLLFLIAVMLTSCSSFTSSVAIGSTDTMEATMALAWTEVVETQVAIYTITPSPQPPTPILPTPLPQTPTPFFSFPVDRHDPESIIRAYFDAMVRKDEIAVASIEGRSFVNYIFDDSIESIHVSEIQFISSPSPDKRIYNVLFEVQRDPEQDDNEARNGKYQWKFTLTWDANRDSWFVTSHGYG